MSRSVLNAISRYFRNHREHGFTIVEILVTMAIGGIIMLLAYLFISRAFYMHRVFTEKTTKWIVQQQATSLISTPFAEKITQLSDTSMIIHYNLARMDTIILSPASSILTRNGKPLHLTGLHPRGFQISGGENQIVKLICEKQSYEWLISIPAHHH